MTVELDWSTFVLEIINFLVLVWILKRFLYKPVLDVIAKRRAGIEKELSQAQAMRTEAHALRERYEGRLAESSAERQRAADALAREMEAERARRMEELRATLDREREKAQAAEAGREADARHGLEATALEHAARFAARLLEKLAGPDLEARLIDRALGELEALPAERIATLRGSVEAAKAIVVISAFPLAAEHRERLSRALGAVTRVDLPVSFEQDEALVAGLQVKIGAWLLSLNLRDELEGFARLAHG